MKQTNFLTRRFKRYVNYVNDHDFLLALLIAVVTIVIASVLGWYNNRVVPLYPYPHFHYVGKNLLGFLANWDGPNYLYIAQHGYSNIKLFSFFPLYPILIKAGFYVFRSYLYSALFISWTSMVVASYFFIKICKQIKFALTQSDAARALLFFILFPTGIFLIATYTEPLFAALALGSIYAVLKHRFWLTIPLLMLATATHITGAFVVLLILVMMWEERASFVQIILTLFSGLGGLAGFMIYAKIRINNAFAFVRSQVYIHKWFENSYLNLLKTTDIFNIILVLLVILAAIYFWHRRISFSLYSLLFLLIPILGKQWGGFNRYVLIDFPIQFMLTDYYRKNRGSYTYIIVLFAVLWTYTALQYLGGYIGS
jgi:hypothetical protein